MTRRERMEARADKREQWANGARETAAAKFSAADRAVDGIPFGQPVLVGHYSEKRHRAALARCDSNMRAGFERSDMATRHENVADTLRDRLETNIFSDDDNAIEALEARIAEREAERDRIKRYNASCRKAIKEGRACGDATILDEKQQADALSLARHASYQLRGGAQFPAYVAANLSGRIKADRDRLAAVKRATARRIQAEESEGGISILKNVERNWCTVTFAEKPEREILNALRSAGYGWGGGSWSGYLNRLPDLGSGVGAIIRGDAE